MRTYSSAYDVIIEACREADKLGNPMWLEDIIDLAIDVAPELMDSEEWLKLCGKLEQENY